MTRRWRCRAAAAAALLLGAAGGIAPVHAQIGVVAATPDLKSLAEAVGGENVHVETLVPPGADGESFEPRPSHLTALRAAKLVVRVGLGYDHWLDRLLDQTGDPALQRGGAGYVDASAGIPLLEMQGRGIDASPGAGSGGHAHGLANPHYWLDPANAEIITAGILEGLDRVAPEGAARFAVNRERFLAVLRARLAGWTSALAPFRGTAVAAYHNAWPYFARRFHLDVVEVIEPKEGVAPSAARLARLAAAMRERKVRAILQEPFAPDDAARLLAGRTEARVAVLAPSVGAAAGAGDYLALFEYDVDTLVRAFSGAS